MIKKKLIIGAVALVSAVAVAGNFFVKGSKAPVGMPVEITTLAPMELSNTVSLTGIVESVDGRKVYSSLTYPIDKVNVKIGDTVKTGDILCSLESDSIQLDIAQQQATIASSKELSAHQIEMSEKAYQKAKDNYDNGLDSGLISAESGISQAENSVEQAEAAAAQADDSVAAARAAVANARENYRIAQSQANGQVDSAREALSNAQAALTKAQSEYNGAVSSIPGAVDGLKESFNQIQADYDEAYRLQKLDLEDVDSEISGYNASIDDKNNQLLNNANLTNEQKEELLKQIEELRQSIRTAETRKKNLLEDFSNVQDNYTQAKASNETAIASVQSQASNAAGAVSSAQSQVNSAKSAYNSTVDSANGSSLNSLDQSIDSARRSKDSSETQLDTAERQIENAEKQVETAKKQKEASENAIQQQLDTLKDQIRSSEISANNTQAQEIAIKKLQDSLNDTIVKSPIDGTITAVYATEGEPGNGLLFVIEDTNALKISTKIKEYDIANTKEGMKTIIRTDATGDKEILGSVSKINPVAIKNEKGDTQSSAAVEFDTEIGVSEKDTGLKIGMTARLKVILSERENVYGVPYDAIVKNEDGSSSVFITETKEDETVVAKSIPVTTGLETDFYVEVSGTDIKDGVSVLNTAQGIVEGQTIIPNVAGASGISNATQGAVMMIG